MNEQQISEIKGLNEDLFKEFFVYYYPKMKAFLLGFIDDEMQVEDMVQELFTKIWELRVGLEIKNVNAYLFKAARNLLYKYWLDLNHKSACIDDFPDVVSTDDIEEFIFQEEMLRKIYVELDKLPTKRKKIFIMSRMNQLSNHEIASKLHLSTRTVETQIYFVLKKLRGVLKILILWSWFGLFINLVYLR